MDQPVAAQSSETIDEILDDISDNQTFRRIDRPGEEPVVVMSMEFYQTISTVRAALETCWHAADSSGLASMTLDDINDEIAAVRRERLQSKHN